jgi:hypothetical protein
MPMIRPFRQLLSGFRHTGAISWRELKTPERLGTQPRLHAIRMRRVMLVVE